MADKEYLLKWVIDPSKAVSGAQAIRAELLDLEQVVDRLGPKLKGLGRGVSGLTRMAGGADKLTAALKATDREASTLGPKLKDVGKGNSGLGRMAGRATKLRDALQTVETQANQTTTSLNGVGAASLRVGKSTGTARGSLVAFGAALMAIHEGREIFNLLMRQSQELRDYWEKLAKDTEKFRDSLRELANITGKNGPDNSTVGNVLDLALGMAVVPEKAREAAAAYENIGPAVRQKGHYKPAPGQGTPEELEKNILIEAGRSARRMGMDPKVALESIGMAGLHHTFTGTEQAMDVFGGAMEGLSEGKLEYNKGAVALNKAMAKLLDPEAAEKEGAKAGKVGGYDEGGVYMGVLSLGTGTPDQAQHRMVQISRVLNTTDEKAREALKGAGVRDDMTDPQKLIQLSRTLNQQADPIAWLEQHNLGTVATREAVVAGAKESDVLQKRLSRLRQGGVGKRTIQENAKHFASDRSAIRAKAEAAEAVREITEGEKQEPMDIARQFARTQMLNDGYRGSWAETMDAAMRQVGIDAQGDRVDAMVIERALAKADQAGIGEEVRKAFPGITQEYNPSVRRDFFNYVAPRLAEKGIDPYGVDETVDTQRKNVDQLRKGGVLGPTEGKLAPGKQVPVNRPAKPAGPQAALGKAGAGVEMVGLNLDGKGGNVMDAITTLEGRIDRGGNDMDGITTAPLRLGGEGGNVMDQIVTAKRRTTADDAGIDGRGQGEPGPQAKVDASSLDRAADKLNQAAMAIIQASRSGVAGGLGGAFDDYEPETPGYGPTRS